MVQIAYSRVCASTGERDGHHAGLGFLGPVIRRMRVNLVQSSERRGRKARCGCRKQGRIMRRLQGEAGKRAAVGDGQTRKCRPESALNRRIIISNDGNPLVDGRWGHVEGREGMLYYEESRTIVRCATNELRTLVPVWYPKSGQTVCVTGFVVVFS